jgi:hypothetical protein
VIDGRQLGQPDLVIELPQPYTLRAEGADVFRNFVYDLNPTAVGVQNNVTFARNFGGITDHYLGYDLTVNGRYRGGMVQGGLNAQRRIYDSCNAPVLSGTTAGI